MTQATLFYYHDPMCSWCWGYRPVSDRLFQQLPGEVSLEYILGGLAPDSDDPMEEDMRQALPGYWKKIHDMLGTEFNFDFWTQCEPRRSTYPACRAVIAAAQQGAGVKMIDAIQRAYYLRAMNPSDVETHLRLAQEIELDTDQFQKDITSGDTEDSLQRQLAFTRASPVSGFPSLVLKIDQAMIPIKVDYQDHTSSLNQINEILAVT